MYYSDKNWTKILTGDMSGASGKRVGCYFGSWAVYRPGFGKFDVENIDPFICDFVVYSFAGLNPTTYQIQSLDPYNDLYDNYGKGKNYIYIYIYWLILKLFAKKINACLWYRIN